MNLPCFAVGGDYFDYFKLDDGRIALAIADVAGKGVPAALLMSNLQAILRAECARGGSVPHVPAQANRQLMESMGGNSKFVTFFYGALDPVARRLSYSNAGHNPPLVVRADGGIEELADGRTHPRRVPARRVRGGARRPRTRATSSCCSPTA